MSAAQAIQEIRAQLTQQGGAGNVWIDSWGERYQSSLGKLRDFLSSQPQLFTVVPGNGSKYSVKLNTGGAKGSMHAFASQPYAATQKGNKGPSGAAAYAATRTVSAGGKGSWQGGGKAAARLALPTPPSGPPPRPPSVPPPRPPSVPLARPPSSPLPQADLGPPQIPQAGWTRVVASEVIHEIKTQLASKGGSGSVWIEDWNARFKPHLSCSLREFIESHLDKFAIAYGPGNKFTVSLMNDTGSVQARAQPVKTQQWQQRQQPQHGQQQPWEQQAAVMQALSESVAQLQQQGGTGQIWIENWSGRFGQILGCNPREFLESHPDVFSLSYGPGNKYSVSLITGDIRKRSFDVAQAGNLDLVAAGAINAITEQLQAQGGSGRVWIDNWAATFGNALSCTTPRAFIESRPDLFTLILGDGNKFTVSLRSTSGTPRPNQGAKRARSYTALSDEVIAELETQLRNPKNLEGKVWVQNWNQVYKDSLGNLRNFLESKPEKFLVCPGEGSKYTVVLLE
eukprot:TRINITY_DN114833_c0_g1_i1.p1 TRINITY_DN114833_c0_g1~~TRINITY_DN114833_c0_g1_i1.p1  ORF type:complete len:511 (+),score=95.12 TRINITY_DN114833_c0_g1_i1:79-1611(+)